MQRPRNLYELVDRQCEAAADVEILIFVDVAPDGRLIDERRTFADLRRNATRLAGWLQRVGVRPGDRVVLMMNNHPEFVEAMLACAVLGATFVPIDPRSLGEKLAYMLGVVECAVAIVGPYALPAIQAVASDLAHLRDVVVIGQVPTGGSDGLAIHGFDDLSPGEGHVLQPAQPDPAAPMFMMFTSGTTGHPKAVVRSHRSYMSGVKGLSALGVTEGDRLYTGLPLSHINAHSTLCAGLSMTLPVVIGRRFTKSRLWDICRAYGCTVFTLLGGMIPEVYSAAPQPDDADNPVRLIIASGMPADLWGAYRTRFGVEITEVYGSTEAGGVLINRLGEGPAGSMGKPPQGTEAAILAADDTPCRVGQPGELCFRPANGAAGPVTYFQNDAASESKVKAGWFRSGDIAHMDAEGWFWFHHRAGGGVRRNGDFVNTALVETVLAKSPLVDDVFVYGVQTPDCVAGEKTLVAAVVLQARGRLRDVAGLVRGKAAAQRDPRYLPGARRHSEDDLGEARRA